MRILQIRSEFKVNGPGIHAVSLAGSLAKRGHHVVAVSSGGDLTEELERNGVHHYRVPTLARERRSVSDVLDTTRQLREIIRTEATEVIHGHNAAATSLAQFASRAVHFPRGVPALNTVHGTGKEWFAKYAPCDLIVVADFKRQELIRRGIKPQRIVTVYNGVDTQRFTRRPKQSPWPGRKVVGIVAVMNRGKGHEYLVEAARAVADRIPEVLFVHVGDGPLRPELERRIHELHLEDNVVLLGMRRDVPALLPEFEVFTLPSEIEVFPLAILEAMACGKPVVATNVGGIPEMISPGVNGYLIPPKDPWQLATALTSLLLDPSTAESMGKTGRDLVEQRFSEELMINRLEALYRDAIADSR
ncbi:MAG: glycosyltransferase [Symbiobacteriia bacterium]